MSRSCEPKENLFSSSLSISSEKDLDNLNDLLSCTSTEIKAMNGQSERHENVSISDPGSGIPSHQQHTVTDRPPKHKKQKSNVSFNLDGIGSSEVDRGLSIHPLPEPQTDVPIFSVNVGQIFPDSSSFSKKHLPESNNSSPETKKERKHKSRRKKMKSSTHLHSSEKENQPSSNRKTQSSLSENLSYSSLPIRDFKVGGDEIEKEILLNSSQQIPTSSTHSLSLYESKDKVLEDSFNETPVKRSCSIKIKKSKSKLMSKVSWQKIILCS